MQCSNPDCRATWSIGAKVDLSEGVITGTPPTMTATVSVRTRRLPRECPACGEVRR